LREQAAAHAFQNKFQIKLTCVLCLLAALNPLNRAQPYKNIMSDKTKQGVTIIDSNLAPLTKAEAQQLEQREQIIKQGITAFKQVAEALLEIRDQRLFRAQYSTFEDYCREKWGMTRRHADRLLLANAVVENLESDQLVSKIPVAIPVTEAQARPMAALPPKQQVEVGRIVAAQTKTPTAQDFQKAVQKVANPAKKDNPPEAQVEAEPKPEVKSYNPKKEDAKAKLSELMEMVDDAESELAAPISRFRIVTLLLVAFTKPVAP
jgi:hypothetical protein